MLLLQPSACIMSGFMKNRLVQKFAKEMVLLGTTTAIVCCLWLVK